MTDTEECYYEKRILQHRKWFFCYVVLAILVPIVVLGVVWGFDKPSSWISRAGAVMAAIAFLAHLKSDAMLGVLKPGGMVGMSFSGTKKKYLPRLTWYGRVAVTIVLVGTVVWGFGDLLPVGISPP